MKEIKYFLLHTTKVIAIFLRAQRNWVIVPEIIFDFLQGALGIRG